MSVHTKSSVMVSLAGGDTIEVRELAWPDALELYNKLLGQAKDLLDEKGQFNLQPEKIVGALTENIGLGQWLVKKATGKDDAWLKERSLSDVLDIATEAAVLNVGIIVTRIKNAKSRLQALASAGGEVKST